MRRACLMVEGFEGGSACGVSLPAVLPCSLRMLAPNIARQNLATHRGSQAQNTRLLRHSLLAGLDLRAARRC